MIFTRERIAVPAGPRRLLGADGAWLLVSLALHAVAFGLLPHAPQTDYQSPVPVLDVVLVKAEAPAAVAVEEPRQTPGSGVRYRYTKPQPVTQRPVALQPSPTAEITRPVALVSEPLTAPVAEATVASGLAGVDLPAVAPASSAPVALEKAVAVAVTPPVYDAAYLSNPVPRYPLAARRNGEHGTVTLRVRVTREGAAAQVSLQHSSGSPHLDRAASDAVKNWRFVPARQGAQTIEAWVLVPVVFRLEG